MKLVIFDLDHTLVDLISIHDEATRELFKKFFGVDARLTEIDFAGKSLVDNFGKLAQLKKIPEEIFRKESHQLLENYETIFIEKLPKGQSKYILPGAKELLRKLPKTRHMIALCRGNSPAIVSSLLRVTNLDKYFKFCLSGGTEVAARADMVRLAIEKAKKLTGQEFRDRKVVVIGDSIRDIECGKLFNALTIAVATGFHSQDQLSAAGPDFLFASLKDYRKVLKAIDQLSTQGG